MTVQALDELIYKGEKLGVYETPLDDLLACGGLNIEFSEISTALWRGYLATWEVVDNRLYLTELEGNVGMNRRPSEVTLKDVFPGYEAGLFAHWYSGTLRCDRYDDGDEEDKWEETEDAPALESEVFHQPLEGMAPEESLIEEKNQTLFLTVVKGLIVSQRWRTTTPHRYGGPMLEEEPELPEDDEDAPVCQFRDLIRVVDPETEERSSYPSDPRGRVPHKPFGHMHAGWVLLLSQMEPGDQLWLFKSPPRSLEHSSLGYAVVRRDKLIAEFIFERIPE